MKGMFMNGCKGQSVHNLFNIFYFCQQFSEKTWRKWVDHKFVHVIPPNIYRTHDEAVSAFEYIATSNNLDATSRFVAMYGGSSIMYVVAKKLKKKYNITDERMAIYECGQEWCDAINLDERPFHGGNQPDLADLAVYGVLSSIEGFAYVITFFAVLVVYKTNLLTIKNNCNILIQYLYGFDGQYRCWWMVL